MPTGHGRPGLSSAGHKTAGRAHQDAMFLSLRVTVRSPRDCSGFPSALKASLSQNGILESCGSGILPPTGSVAFCACLFSRLFFKKERKLPPGSSG